MTPTATDFGTHKLTSGPRYLGQSLRALAAFDEGRGYLEWVRRGGGELVAEDRAAVREFLKHYRKPSPDPVPRRWPSASVPNKRREAAS